MKKQFTASSGLLQPCQRAPAAQSIVQSGTAAHVQVKLPGVFKAVWEGGAGSQQLAPILFPPSPLCMPSPLQMGPTAFSAFIQYSFIPEDVVGVGMVSRRYPRFSFLCQGFV